MSYQVRFLIIVFAFFLTPLFSATEKNCDDLVLAYRVEHCNPAFNDGKIYIKVTEGVFPLTFRLFDLKVGDYEFSAEKTIYSQSDEEFLVFDALAASDYVIQVTNSTCRKTIGGIEGITISRNQ